MLKSGWLSIVHDENCTAAKGKQRRKTSINSSDVWIHEPSCSKDINGCSIEQCCTNNSAEYNRGSVEQIGGFEFFVFEYVFDYDFTVKVFTLIVGSSCSGFELAS